MFLRHALSFVPAAVLLAGVAPLPAPVPSTVVLVVRHAERAPGTGDVAISDAGQLRARALAGIGKELGVQAVIHTQFQRTRQTAEPLMQAAGLTSSTVTTQADVATHVEAVAAAVRLHAGKVVLVVGHSNTVPGIVAALGGTRYPDLCESEYDALFTVIIDPDGTVRTLRSRFGAPTPVGAGCAPMPGMTPAEDASIRQGGPRPR